MFSYSFYWGLDGFYGIFMGFYSILPGFTGLSESLSGSLIGFSMFIVDDYWAYFGLPRPCCV